jgi:hypothetical protein
VRHPCGFWLQVLDQNGKTVHEFPCHKWACPHQPVTEHEVWVVQPIRGGSDIWHFIGRFEKRLDAREAELRTNPDWYSYITPVSFCRWPVQHPQPLTED